MSDKHVIYVEGMLVVEMKFSGNGCSISTHQLVGFCETLIRRRLNQLGIYDDDPESGHEEYAQFFMETLGIDDLFRVLLPEHGIGFLTERWLGDE